MRKQSELINFMKGTSISAIVLFHLIYDYLEVPAILATASKLGGAGIHVFFLCSGFGLTLSQLRKPQTYPEFLKRRFGKIYLPYMLIVILSAAMPFLYTGSDRLLALLSHGLLFKMFIPRYISSFGAHFWFVSTIFQFYFVFPLLERLRRREGDRKFWILCCAASLGWMLLTAALDVYAERVWGSFFLQYLWEFGLGMCLGAFFHRNQREPRFPGPALTGLVTAVALVLYGAMALTGGPLTVCNDVFGAAAFTGICLLLYRISWLRGLMCGVNRISYELYLVHILVFSGCEQLLSPWLPNFLWCVIALGTAFLAAWLYARLWNRK